MPFSEESGGFGFGPIELSILFEEFGKSLVIEPYLSNVVLAGSVLDKSNFEGKIDLIEATSKDTAHPHRRFARQSGKSINSQTNSLKPRLLRFFLKARFAAKISL